MRPIEDLERSKYHRVWEHEPYRRQSDGVTAVALAVYLMGCRRGSTIIDWGCGTGITSQCLQSFGLSVIGFDIAENCLNEGVYVPLVVGNLWDIESIGMLEADYGFSSDVLEHIPPRHLDAAIDTIFLRSRYAAYIQVDTVKDSSGPRMKPPTRLHLSVHNGNWWEEKLKQRWPEVVRCPGSFSRVGFACLK